MNYWLIALFVWFVIELIRYIQYCIIYKRLNGMKCNKPLFHENIRNFIADSKRFPEMFAENIKDMFYQRVALEDINFEDLCEGVYENMGEDPRYINDIKKLVKRTQLYYRKHHDRDIFAGIKFHKRIRHKNDPIKSWFPILPIFLITRGFNIVIQIYMKFLGYKCYTFPNKLRVWHNEYDPKKGTPLIFIHASVGGISLQFTLLKYYAEQHNIIMPEIPGISFIDTPEPPPTITEITNNIHTFIHNIYLEDIPDLDPRDLSFNLMGHSLGNTICAGFINHYPKMISHFFCVEGMIFTNRCLKIFTYLETDLYDIPREDLITVPLFHRDLYVQYFIARRASIDNGFIYNLDGDASHIKIHMFHIKTDLRLAIQPQLEYATLKKIPVSYHLFNGNYLHGSFVMSSRVREYVINTINNIYLEES